MGYVSGHHFTECCGRFIYLYEHHRLKAPLTCRRVFGRGDLGRCISDGPLLKERRELVEWSAQRASEQTAFKG
jgi:hypothetical protein